jgi:hypothetical protein
MKSPFQISSVFPLVDAASNPGAKLLVPDWGIQSQPPYAIVDYFPQTGTKNLASASQAKSRKLNRFNATCQNSKQIFPEMKLRGLVPISTFTYL